MRFRVRFKEYDYDLTFFFQSRKGSFFYGKVLLNKFLSGEAELGSSSTNSSSYNYFPLVTVCDVTIKELNTAEPHLYQFSCILTSNLFSEKIFMLLWLWYVLVLLPLGSYQLFKYAKALGFRQSYHRYMYLKRRLGAFVDFKHDKRLVFLMHLFSEYYLHADDVLMLALIEANSSLVVATELLDELWVQFLASLEEFEED